MCDTRWGGWRAEGSVGRNFIKTFSSLSSLRVSWVAGVTNLSIIFNIKFPAALGTETNKFSSKIHFNSSSRSDSSCRPSSTRQNIIIARASAFKDDFLLSSFTISFINTTRPARSIRTPTRVSQTRTSLGRVQKGNFLVTVAAVAGKPLKRLDVHDQSSRSSLRGAIHQHIWITEDYRSQNRREQAEDG